MPTAPRVPTPVLTLTGAHTHCEEIKRSRFLAHAAPAPSVEAATAWLADCRDATATHNAWAYRIGPAVRAHDDGEVGGTAGRPILGAIEKQGLDRVVVLVIRHYGGIKLGAGGLVRAYGGVAATCLQNAPRRLLTPRRRARLTVAFADQGRVMQVCERLAIERCGTEFAGTGVILEIACPIEQYHVLQETLRDLTRGRDLNWQVIADETA